jgi:AraC-like DNA-binding protein
MTALGGMRDLLIAHLNQASPDYPMARSAIALLREEGNAGNVVTLPSSFGTGLRVLSCAWAARLFRELVQFHHGHVKLAICDPCSAAGIPERNFSRYFQQVYKEKPGEYHSRIRLERAVHLLKSEPGMSIEEVGRQLGYEEAGDFSKFFRRRSGMTPRECRNYSQTPFLLVQVAS